jgi:hypothetical protein
VKPTYLVLPSPVLPLRVILQRLCLTPTRPFGKRSTVRSVNFDFYYSFVVTGKRSEDTFIIFESHIT